MTVRPGAPVRGSASGRPIMAVLDLLGRRSLLRIIWELRDGPLTFRALQQAADTNPGVLNARLAELRDAGAVAHDGEGYALTEEGRRLLTVLEPLREWAQRWAARS
jgi:DNA-binding HxlR family transcriptional regulator